MDKKQYRPLIVPKLTWSKKELSNTFGELVAQPLETGFGITLGNALRRILLGGVEGSAVTWVVIKGVNNEFSAVSGVHEDAMQLILNIKNIVIRNKEGKPGKMHLQVKGESVARVADIKTDDHIELVNKNHVIGNVSSDGVLDIEFFVETGRGYKAAQWPTDKSLQDDNRIYIDAMFSPVRKVTFEVEKTRVGKDIDYDKLILGISTDGAENPIDVLHYAVSVLRNQLEHFLNTSEIPFNEISALPSEEKKQEPEAVDRLNGISVELLAKPIEELELSVRAHNCLINAGIKRIIDLVNLSEDEVLKIKNFGRKSLNEVRENMKELGLSFGMNIKESQLKKALKNPEEL
jgi:DNA-directed RNA polymerase subunit alpha